MWQPCLGCNLPWVLFCHFFLPDLFDQNCFINFKNHSHGFQKSEQKSCHMESRCCKPEFSHPKVERAQEKCITFMMYYLLCKIFYVNCLQNEKRISKVPLSTALLLKNNTKRTSRDGQSVQQQRQVKKIKASFSVSTNHDM